MSATVLLIMWLRSRRRAFNSGFVISECHAAFAGGGDFDRVKAEYGDVAVLPVANGFVFVFAANGMRGIFDDFEAVLLTKGMNASHNRRLSSQMHGDHYFG